MVRLDEVVRPRSDTADAPDAKPKVDHELFIVPALFAGRSVTASAIVLIPRKSSCSADSTVTGDADAVSARLMIDPVTLFLRVDHRCFDPAPSQRTPRILLRCPSARPALAAQRGVAMLFHDLAPLCLMQSKPRCFFVAFATAANNRILVEPTIKTKKQQHIFQKVLVCRVPWPSICTKTTVRDSARHWSARIRSAAPPRGGAQRQRTRRFRRRHAPGQVRIEHWPSPAGTGPAAREPRV